LPLPSPSDERRGKVRRLTSPAPPEKKARKKWTMEETQMLVEGCNRVGVPSPLSWCLNASLIFLVSWSPPLFHSTAWATGRQS
jgi:hypothetical protein